MPNAEGGRVMSKHNARQWTVKPSYSDENAYRLWDKNDNYFKDTSPDTMDANARLMASAPDLLDALQALYTLMQHPLTIEQADLVIKQVTQAINKATGQGKETT
jgi:hypothetical protein